MAYAATVTTARAQSGEYIITVAETGAGAATEWDVLGVGATVTGTGAKLPPSFRIIRCKCILGAGAGATVDPIIGSTANPSGVAVILQNGTAAATIDLQPIGGAVAVVPGLNIFGRSICDAGADNDVSWEIIIAAGVTE